MCESRGGRPGLLPVPNNPYSPCGRKATLNSWEQTWVYFEDPVSLYTLVLLSVFVFSFLRERERERELYHTRIKI